MTEKLIVLAEGSEDIGRQCPRCQKPLAAGDEVVYCPRCHKPHHLECWKENRGCATRGCPQVAEVYKSEEIRAGRDERVMPKVDRRPYIIGGVVLLFLLAGYHFFGPKPPNPAEGKIALEVMVEGNIQEQNLYEEIAKSFNESQNEIYVFASTAPPGGYEQKLLIMIGARSAPDIFTIRFQRFTAFAENEALVPLNHFLEGSPVAETVGSRLEKGTLPDGRVMGLPHPGKPEILAVSTQSENPEAAWRFLEYVVLELHKRWPKEWVIPDDVELPSTPIFSGF